MELIISEILNQFGAVARAAQVYEIIMNSILLVIEVLVIIGCILFIVFTNSQYTLCDKREMSVLCYQYKNGEVLTRPKAAAAMIFNILLLTVSGCAFVFNLVGLCWWAIMI